MYEVLSALANIDGSEKRTARCTVIVMPLLKCRHKGILPFIVT